MVGNAPRHRLEVLHLHRESSDRMSIFVVSFVVEISDMIERPDLGVHLLHHIGRWCGVVAVVPHGDIEVRPFQRG